MSIFKATVKCCFFESTGRKESILSSTADSNWGSKEGREKKPRPSGNDTEEQCNAIKTNHSTLTRILRLLWRLSLLCYEANKALYYNGRDEMEPTFGRFPPVVQLKKKKVHCCLSVQVPFVFPLIYYNWSETC